MKGEDRRVFLKSALVGVVSAGFNLSHSTHALASRKQLAIARYKAPSEDGEAVSEEARRLTRAAIQALGGMNRFVSSGDVVWVKPNLAWDRRPEQAATTNPDVVATVVDLCYEAGADQVLVSDNTCNKAQRTFPRSGIQKAAEEAGARVFFLDKRKFKRMAIGGKVIKDWEVYTEIVEADKLVNLPIVKHHGLCQATLGMKNLMGAIGGRRNQFHQDLSNSLSDLASFLKPTLVVMDAIRVLTANGPIGGNLEDVKRLDTVVAGIDQVAVDSLGASLLGQDPESIGYIAEAARRGLGELDYKSLEPTELAV
jgi:uncharacterized protein (DUF362 family)